MWVVSVTPRPLFTPGKTLYPLYRRLGGPQGRSGQVRKISPPPGFVLRTVQPVAIRYTDLATGPMILCLLAILLFQFLFLTVFKSVFLYFVFPLSRFFKAVLLIEYSTQDVCPLLCPHETARLPTERFFFFNFTPGILSYFSYST